MMAAVVDEEVQRRVGPIVPSSRVETVINPEEELPVATEVIALNDNEAIV